MLGLIKAALSAVGGFFGWRQAKEESAQREADRQAGRNEQAVGNQAEAIERARDANEREEDFDRLSGDALDDRVRKSME